MVKLHEKIRSLQLFNSFLKECIFKRVSPRFINKCIEKVKVRHSPTLERAFIYDEIGKNHTKLQLLYMKLRQSWSSVSKFLSTFNYIRFSRYLADIEQRQRDLINTKHFRNINWLLKQRLGSVSANYSNNICNLSSYKLSDTEKFVLAHGLEFCLPPSSIKREQVFAEFEVLLGQLFHHTSKSKNNVSTLKAELSDLAHSFCNIIL